MFFVLADAAQISLQYLVLGKIIWFSCFNVQALFIGEGPDEVLIRDSSDNT